MIRPLDKSSEDRSAEARALADALDAYVELHGLSSWRVGVYLFKGARSGIAKLRRTRRPTDAVVARVRAFLASDPPPGLHRRPLGGPRERRDCSTGAWLADRLEALIAEHGLSRYRVSLRLYNSSHAFDRLRQRKPHPATVAKAMAILEARNLDSLRYQQRRSRRRVAAQPIVLPAPPKRPLSFEEQLQRVLSGQARVVPKLVIPAREHDFTLAGVSAGML